MSLVWGMLAFDLETTGLDPHKDTITCAAVYDPGAGLERVFFFVKGDAPEDFMALLDQATTLCAFNGASFDIPFIVASFSPPAARVAKWRLKLLDVYVACKWGLGVTFPLQALLEQNGLAGKTGTGGDAVRLFQQGRWDELGSYCLNDTRMTHHVSSRVPVLLPRCQGLTLSLARGDFVAHNVTHGGRAP